jgi:hypothetical protein
MTGGASPLCARGDSRRPVLLMAVVLLLPLPASAQPATSLTLLKPLADERTTVDIVSAEHQQPIRGRLFNVSDAALAIEGPKGLIEFPAGTVREVWNPGGPRYRKPLIIGTAVGLGVGLLAKAGDGDCGDPTSSCALDGPMTGGDIAIVTALGTATGLGWAWLKRHPKRLLYLSREPAATPDETAVRPDWLALDRFRVHRIEVATRGHASTLKGTLGAVTAESIEIVAGGKPVVVPQADVQRVWNGVRAPWWTVPAGALYGAIGLGSLVAVGVCSFVPDDAGSTCAGAAYGISAGTLAAALTYVNVKTRRETLVYDASRPAPATKTALRLQPLLGRRAVGIAGAYSF